MDNKVTVIGFTGSGKTTYLIGMYICMSTGINGFSLLAKDHNLDLYLEKLWNNLCNGQGPDPSNRLETYDFHISHNIKPVCDFEWVDYPGGLLADPLSENRQKLESDIKDSDCILLIVDGEIFSCIEAIDQNDYQQKLEYSLKYNTGIRNEVRMLTMLSAEEIQLPPVGIVVTKCDLIDVAYQNAIRKALRNTFSSLFESSERVVLQMSVSLGGVIEKGFYPEPFCIEQPIAFAVLSILLKYIIAANIQKFKNLDYIEAHNGIWGRLIHSNKINKAKENVNNLGVAVDKWAASAFKLINLFSDKKTIYIGGEERNLRDYYRDIFTELSKMEDNQ